MSEEKNQELINENFEEMETSENGNKLFKEEKKKFILKGISSLIACIFYTFGCFSFWSLGYSIVYLISFRRFYNPDLTFSYGYFLIPIMNFSLMLTSPIGGIIEDKIGGKQTIFLSTIILCISLVFIYISKNIFFDYLIMGLIGLGLAVGINIPRKNACSYFMNKKVLVYGIGYFIPSFLCVGLNIFNEKYILNPLSEAPIIEDIYYSEKIFLNYQKLILFEIGLIIFICFITLILYIQNNPKDTIKFGFNEIIKKTTNKENNNENNKITVSNQIKVKKAIYNIRAIRLFFMIFSFFPVINFINNTWRPIGIYYKIDTYYLQMTGALYCLSSGISTIIFALIGDKIQFKILFVFFAFILTIISFNFCITFNNSILFILEVMGISFIYNGYSIIIDPHMMKVYGIDNYIKIGGIIRSSEGICEILSIFFAFYLENSYSGNKDSIYKNMYTISGCFSLISLVLGLFESDDKFNYNI